MDINKLKHSYDGDFIPSQQYLDTMPDLQNADFVGRHIEQVGIHNFMLPLKIHQLDGNYQEVQASITGTVDVDSSSRGINMSRILRTFYKDKDTVFDINQLINILRGYINDQHSMRAHILMSFKYYMWQDALRTVDQSGNREGGYQFYNVTFDCSMDHQGYVRKVMWIDFTYSSACPCSTELSIHAANIRGVFGIPHSQRSVARIGIEFDNMIWIEDVINMCREVLTTETLVFCKRQDEQAFAEKNGAHPKFVEDAVRLLAQGIEDSKFVRDVIDYKIICSHQESLHNHNAIAVIVRGLEYGFDENVSVAELKDMMA